MPARHNGKRRLIERRALEQQVGGYRIDVVEPLRRLNVSCASPDGSLDFDLHWTAAFPAVQEEPHLLLAGGRPILDASRFSQVGSWSGRLRVAGRDFAVTSDRWAGIRDRSWGIRPVGEPEPDGCRTLNDARRVWPDGRVDQLGWPQMSIGYRPGTRHPESARIQLTDPDGTPLTVQLETVTSVPLHVGAGYSGDPDWSHGRWMGRGWSSSSVYDLSDPAVAARIPFGAIDHLARARFGAEEGWGMFEHASMGRHDPTGFKDWSSVSS